jgi:phosphate transport system permease protein
MSNARFRKRAKRNDRIAVWVITAGGVIVIAAVILILLLIVRVALPLFAGTDISKRGEAGLGETAAKAVAVGVDEYLETAFVIRDNGVVAFSLLDSAGDAEIRTVPPPTPQSGAIQFIQSFGIHLYSLAWQDGSTSLVEVGFPLSYDAQGNRVLGREVEVLQTLPPVGGPVHFSTARMTEDGGTVRATLTEDELFIVEWQVVEEDLLGNVETSTESTTIADPLPGVISAITLDRDGEALYAGTANGHLLRWDVSRPGRVEIKDSLLAFSDQRAITELAMVFGDISLAVGDATGGLSTWFPVRAYPGTEKKQLRLVHALRPHSAPVTQVVPSLRSKSILSLDAAGTIHLDHTTSERALAALVPGGNVISVALAPRANGLAALSADGRVQVWRVESPHPEVSPRTLLGKVHYESYDEPEFVWQSSAASDDFEPKLSLMPLIFGSFKGTFYALLYALPLALFAAVYTSQFASERVRAVVKPVVEIMAAIPSVVIGFLAALWLAPLVESYVVAFLISVVTFPTLLLLFVFLWQPFRTSRIGKRVERGYEFLVLVPLVLLAAGLTYLAGGIIEQAAFDGNFQQWLYSTTGERYDQRNCIIIAFALGFAVIPIIFTIAEDALTSVPHALKAASMALGATRWQTVWRVVLPSASPGIFAGTMIGFGRAVGETMIVLMATGNTPIMDGSVFNGMRTLSANIAVEIPEAPLDGTLYRVLFLSAVILFVLTSIANTAAEIVRQRLRKKYGQF